MFLILLVIFNISFIKADNQNYSIALAKCAQGTSLSNIEKDYLERAGSIITVAVKESDRTKKPDSIFPDDAVLDDSQILDPEDFDQLDFISKKGEGLFYSEEIKKMSYAGKAFLAYLATAQTKGPEVLEKRRNIIVYLQKNPEFKVELQKILALLEKGAQESFLDLKKELTQEEKEAQDKFFLNSSNFIFPDFIMKRIISEKFVRVYANFCLNYPIVFNFFSAGAPVVLYLFCSELLKIISSDIRRDFKDKWFFIGVTKELVDLIKDMRVNDPVNAVIQGFSLFAMHVTFNIANFYSHFKARKDYYRYFLKREDSLVGAQKTAAVAQLLDQLLAKHPEFSKYLLLKSTLQSTRVQSDDNKTSFVLNQFNNQKITSPSLINYCFWGNRVLVNKALVDNPSILNHHLFPILGGLGEVNAYCALADQFKGYSVPRFVKNGLSIKFSQFFHPNLANPVCNDFDFLASHDKRFILVSGANASGKSATARAILASIVCAQTFNLVPAKEAFISQFDRIAIFANLSDNLGVASKFQVELAKLKKFQEYLEKNQDNKVLLMMDEPLTSTDTQIVGKTLSDLFNLFKKYPNLVIMCVSNTSSLKDLKDALHMGMIVEKNPDGTFGPTYKWQEGPAYMSDAWYQFAKIFGPEFGKCN